MCNLRRVPLKQRLASMWDSEVMLGNFSSPTVTESRESSGRTSEDVIISRISLKCKDRLRQSSDPLCRSSWSPWCCAAPSHSELSTCSLRRATALGMHLQSYRARSRSQSARTRKQTQEHDVRSDTALQAAALKLTWFSVTLSRMMR